MLLKQLVQDLKRETLRDSTERARHAHATPTTLAAAHDHTNARSSISLSARERAQLYAFMAAELGIWRIHHEHSCVESRCDLRPDGIVGFSLPGRPNAQVRICRMSGQYHLCSPHHTCRYLIRGIWMDRGSAHGTNVNDDTQWYCLFTHLPVASEMVAEDWKDDDELGYGYVRGDATRETQNAWVNDIAMHHIFQQHHHKGDDATIMRHRDDEDDGDNSHSANTDDDDDDDNDGALLPPAAKRRRVGITSYVSATDHALSMFSAVVRPRKRRWRHYSQQQHQQQRHARGPDPAMTSFQFEHVKRIMEHPHQRRHIFFRPAPSANIGDCDWWELSRTWPTVILRGAPPRDRDETEEQYNGRIMDVMPCIGSDMNCIQPDLKYVAEFDLTTLRGTYDAAGAMFYQAARRTSNCATVPVICEDYHWNDTATSDIVEAYIQRREAQQRAAHAYEPAAPQSLDKKVDGEASTVMAHVPMRVTSNVKLALPCKADVVNFYTNAWVRGAFPTRRGDIIHQCAQAGLDLAPMAALLYVILLDVAAKPRQFAALALKQSSGAAASFLRQNGWFSLCSALIGAGDMACPDIYWRPKRQHRAHASAFVARDNITEKASEVLQSYVSRSLSDICDQVAYVCFHRLPRAATPSHVKDCNQKQINNVLGKALQQQQQVT